jgi:hypothetical protein
MSEIKEIILEPNYFWHCIISLRSNFLIAAIVNTVNFIAIGEVFLDWETIFFILILGTILLSIRAIFLFAFSGLLSNKKDKVFIDKDGIDFGGYFYDWSIIERFQSPFILVCFSKRCCFSVNQNHHIHEDFSSRLDSKLLKFLSFSNMDYSLEYYSYNGMNPQELANFLNEYKRKVVEIETGNAIESNED